MDAMAFILKFLLHDMIPSVRVVIEYPVLWASQRGDRTLVVKNGDHKITSLAQEFKTSPILEHYNLGLSQEHFFQLGTLMENERAILIKVAVN
jgi:hypothetical protein